MLNPIEKVKVAIFHLNRDWNDWFGTYPDVLGHALQRQPNQASAKHGLLLLSEFQQWFQCRNQGLQHTQTVTKYVIKVHWPPMSKFVCKLHGYIVYLS